MGIRYESLDDEVRARMIEELELDLEQRSLYISPRLTEQGVEAWPQLLREAFEDHDDEWLAAKLQTSGLLHTHLPRKKPKGGFTMAKVPVNAADMMAEGEFNRFYARGLCSHVLACGGSHVLVYRGKAVQVPRPESEALIGQQLPARELLEDLRTSQGVEPCLGVPQGPNSGLTICRVEDGKLSA